MSATWFSVSKATLIDILTKLTSVFDTKADVSHSHTKNDITDFPTLGTAAAKDVPSSGNATSSQVVMGSDTRLSDARNAADVYAWAKAASKPTYTATEVGAAASNHDHPLSIAADSGTSALDMAANTVYKLTAGGKTFIFKTPADNDHYAWSDITGKPSSYPPSAHTHTVSQITDFPSTMPPSSHTHGNIQNGGTLQTTDVAIANGDKLVVTDSSDSSKIARASIAFDGSTVTKCLTQKGTWENFTNNAGTITGIKMNGASKGTSGVVDLGTVITSHQDISGKADKTATVSTVAWDSTNKKLTKTINGTTTDVVTGATILGGLTVKVGSTSYAPSSGVVSLPAYPTTLPASDVYAWAKASSKPSYTLDEVSDGSTRKLADYLLKNTAGGIKDCSGNGQYWWYKVGTITITRSYVNRPLVLEISGRGYWWSVIQVMFANRSDADPPLSGFITNNSNLFWIKKTATSTWEIYGKYDEMWAFAVLHRITGCGANIGFTVNMTNLSSDPTSDATQVSYGGNVAYANSAGAVAWSNITNKPTSFTPSSHTHGNLQNGGTLQTNDITIANGDKLVITDSSDSSKIARASISFDGSTATKYLSQKGTWESLTKSMVTSALGYTPPSSDTNNAVTQTEMSDGDGDNYYEVLLSGTADDTTRTEGVKKSNKLVFNSARGIMYCYNESFKVGWNINGGSGESTAATVAYLNLGNATASGTAGNRYGRLRIFSKQYYYSEILTADTYTDNRTIRIPDVSGTMNVLTGEVTDKDTTSRRVIFGGSDGETKTHSRFIYIPSMGKLYVDNSYGKNSWSIWDDNLGAASLQLTTLALGNTTAEGTNGARKGRLVLYSTTSIAAQLTAHTDGTLCNNGYGTIISHDMNNWRITQMVPAGDSSSSYIHCNTTNGAYGINWWLSDTKLKENIDSTKVTALDKVDRINFVQFDWKDRETYKNPHVDLGVSANQIEEFMPDVVWNIKQPEGSEFDTLKNINTGKMTTYALKAIQELHKIVEDQAKEIAELESKLL